MLLHSKGEYNQGEKTTLRMGENMASSISGAGEIEQLHVK